MSTKKQRLAARIACAAELKKMRGKLLTDHLPHVPNLKTFLGLMAKAEETLVDPPAVTLKVVGDNIHITGVGKAGSYFDLAAGINKINGTPSQQVYKDDHKWAGQRIFRSCWKKAAKAFVTGAENAEAIAKFFAAEDIPVETAAE